MKRLDPREVQLSRGFLRSRPEKWFPGFAAQWLPFAHAAGVEISVNDVRPGLILPADSAESYCALLDEEPLLIVIDRASRRALLEAVTPGAVPAAGGLVAEYLARRFVASLALSWTGPRLSSVEFKGPADTGKFKPAGSIKFSVVINDSSAAVWVLLSSGFVERLDGLWRRQIQSSIRQAEEENQLVLEVGRLQVAPPVLNDFLMPGNIIDLNVRASDLVATEVSGKPWLPARLCQIESHLGLEVTTGPAVSLDDGEAGVTLAVQLAPLNVNAQLLAELSQAGAAWDTGMPLSSGVRLMVNNEQAARGELGVQDGRFAVKVLGK